MGVESRLWGNLQVQFGGRQIDKTKTDRRPNLMNIHTIIFVGVQESAFLAFGGLSFWQFLVHQMQQWEWFKFCLDTRNNRAFPLDLAYLKCLSVWSLIILF